MCIVRSNLVNFNLNKIKLMKKLIFLPLIFAAFISLSHTKDDIKAKDMSFTSFLQLFPKEKLPYKISMKQIIKSTKKELVINSNTLDRQSVNSIFKKYLPNSDEGNRAGDRGYFINCPVAQVALNDYYLVFYSRHFMGESRFRQYYVSVLDKQGQHILTEPFANFGWRGYLAGTIDKKLNMVIKEYSPIDEKDKNTGFILAATTKTNLMMLIYKTLQAPIAGGDR